MLAVLGFWAVPLTKAIGGRGAHTELVFQFVLIAALICSRAWRARSSVVVLSAIVSIAALGVCCLSPTGWWGADVAVGYVASAGTFVVAHRYVHDASRIEVLAAAVCLADLFEFSKGFFPWWGSSSAATEMSGTFYWHNPYAAYLLPGAILGLSLVTRGRSPLRLVGWMSAPLCTVGIVYSSSRASLAVLVLAWLVLLATLLRARCKVRGPLAVVALSIGLVFAVPGPPLFAHYSSPLAAQQVRAAKGETLSQNGAYRKQFWHEAATIAAHHPATGAGFHSLATASALYTPSGWARSQLAHNGYLQSFSDGGLLLGLPFLVSVAGFAFWAMRRLLLVFRRRDGETDPIVAGLAVAVLAAMLHSGVDFDWSHPSILIELCVMAACLAPTGSKRPHQSQPRSRLGAVVRGGAIAALVGAMVVSVAALHRWQLDQPTTLDPPASLLASGSSTFGDFRPGVQVLQDFLDGTQPVTRGQALTALGQTKDEAAVNLHHALLRLAAQAKLGLVTDSAAAADRVLATVAGTHTPYEMDLVTIRYAAGDTEGAMAMLTGVIAGQAAAGQAAPDLTEAITFWAKHFGTNGRYGCQLDAYVALGLNAAAVPKPSAACPVGSTVKVAE
ncbi:MAG: O-antigen ligase family protein [Frankiaceae bacterium]|nr:O-antigen ligase family protein [Frankiaceae bacterium]MBV9872335.1 O-antigen ligase family protein [Frankiaceae bacterium]